MTPVNMPSQRVLIVDRDQAFREQISRYLQPNGFAPYQAGDAIEAKAVLSRHPVALMIVDAQLPGEGLSFCNSFSDQMGRSGPLVLMLGDAGDVADRVLALEFGVDNYLVKPITPREVLAHARALLRRPRSPAPNPEPASHWRFADFALDMGRRQLTAPSGELVMLTPGEMALLHTFLSNPTTLLGRDELCSHLQTTDRAASPRSVDIHVSRLRQKLRRHCDQDIIKTHRGLGYLLNVRVQTDG